MSTEKAQALVIRATDFSETSRIVTLWSREFGQIRALAKGGRRLKSSFECALDLLTVCDIVVLRKSSGNLDLLTEARVRERFPLLRHDLQALYAAYYIGELLGAWSQDYDPHPTAFDAALESLRNLGKPDVITGACVAHFELVLLRELGYGPALDACASCNLVLSSNIQTNNVSNSLLSEPLLSEPLLSEPLLSGQRLAFSAAGGGVLCSHCHGTQRERRALADATWVALRQLAETGDGWHRVTDTAVRRDVRQILDHYVSYLLGRRPRLLPYLGS